MTTTSRCPVCRGETPLDDIRILHFDLGVAHFVCRTCAPRLDTCPFCQIPIVEFAALGAGRGVVSSGQLHTELETIEENATPFEEMAAEHHGFRWLFTATVLEMLRQIAPLLCAVGMLTLYSLTMRTSSKPPNET